MAKRTLPPDGRGARTSGNAEPPATSTRAPRTTGHGGRAVPGKVPRGALHSRATVPDLSPLGRTVLDKIDRGILLLDADGTVLDGNATGRAVLAHGNGLTLRNSRFSFTNAALDARLERLLNASGKAGDGTPRLVAASVKRPGSASCRVLVSPIKADDNPAPAAVYLVVIYAPSEQHEIAAEVLLEIYGLTRAQADVARRLYTGLSVEETASELKLSLNTVRTHLKQIFSKCEVQSQAELLHALALGPQSF